MATVVTRTTAGAGSTIVPAGATSAKIECWGTGGGGYGGGGSGGAYSRVNALTVAAGNTLYYSLSAPLPGNNPEANPGDTWVRITTNAAPTTTAQGCLAKSGKQAEPSGFTGQAGGQASACVGDVKFSGGAAGNSNGVESGGGGGGAAGDANAGGSAVAAGSNHTGGIGGAVGGGNGGHGDVNNTQGQNGFAPGGGGGGNWLGSDFNGALGKIIITFNDGAAAINVTGAQTTLAATQSVAATVGVAVTRSAQPTLAATQSSATKVLAAVTGAQTLSPATTSAAVRVGLAVTGAQTTLATTQTGTIVLSIAGQATVSGAQTTSAATTGGAIGLGEAPVEPPVEVPSGGGGGSRAYRRRLREAREGRRVFEEERAKRIAALGIERPPLIPAPETVTMIARVLYEPIVRPIEVEPTQPEFEDDGEEEELLLLMLAS